VAAALILAFPSGGYFITDWGVASIVLLTLLAVVVLTLDVSFGGPWGALALGGLVGLGVWQGISSMWALQPSAAINAMNQTLLYAAAFALVLVGVRHASDLNALLWSALAGSGLVTAFALASRLLPDLVSGDDQTRLSAPISYWNGLGAIVAFGALLSIGMAAHSGMPNWARACAGALTPMFLLALLLTFSRGAAAALIVGLGLLLALAPGRIETVAATILTVAASVPLLLIANGEAAIAALSGTLPPHEAEGRRILLILVATMISSGVIAFGAAMLLGRLPARGRRISGLAIAACAVIGVAALLLVKMPEAGPVGWTEQQITSFKTFDTGARADAASVSDRLAVAAGSGRWQNWGVAADQFRASPIVGTGAGDYVFFWQQNRDVDLTVVNAHSLYLEILGETGLVGLLLLLLPVGAIGLAFLLYRRENRDSARARTVAVALSAAALIGIHAAGDWDWQLPAIVLPAVALAAGGLKVMLLRESDAPRRGVGLRPLAALGAILALVLIVGPTVSSSSLADARSLAVQGDLEGALDLSDDAVALAPLDPAPRLLRAHLLSDLGRGGQANAAFAAAVARSPNDWRVFADWALSLRDRGDREGALAAAERAVSLNPRESQPVFLLESLKGAP
jgi:hypothetical protein